MMRWRWIVATACVCGVACSSGDGDGTPVKKGNSAPPKGSAGGFSATLSAELAKEGSGAVAAGSAVVASAGSGGGSGANNNGSGTGSGSATRTGSDADAGRGSARTGSATEVAATAPRDAGATVVKPANDAGLAKTANDAGLAKTASDAGLAKAATDAGLAKTAADAGAPIKVVEHHDPVKLTPELAAIKLDLLPNWERDKEAPATFSLLVKLPKTGEKLFTFHYGYDLPGAPADRELYKKQLADQKVLAVDLDRQRGSAWYLEGTNSDGARAFRYLVTYGGKRLACWGTLYRDAEHDPMGDLRDNVVIQAKQICESLSL